MHRHAFPIALTLSLVFLGHSAVAQGIGTPYCDATPNSSGHPAHVQAHGSASVAANDLVLVAAPVPNELGLFFWGPDQNQVPFGNGFLCASGAFTVRIDPVELAQGNLARRRVDLPINGIFGPGERNFQYWFRDPLAGGASFNLSNGVNVSFVP